MHTNHIAFLTRNLEAVAESLPAFCKRHPIEDQPTEGTREQYVEVAGETAPSLLLVQPIAEGPYLRAMKKRGPGLHHIGGATRSIRGMLPRIMEHGLLLHPISLSTYPHKTIWLCRPGVPFLIELIEGESSEDAEGACELCIPSRRPIPESIRGFFSNTLLKSSEDDRFHFRAGDTSVALNPGLGE